jgi:hypothetical protein
MRQLGVDLLQHARRVPSLSLGRTLNATEIALALQELQHPPSWVALFLRAYGLLSQRHPELRRVLIPWPWQHVYEHPHSVCLVPIEREYFGESVALPAKIRAPETLSLEAIDSELRKYREGLIWEVPSYRQILRLGHLPGFVRRLALWQGLRLSGYRRVRRFGTFVLSSLGSPGAEPFHPLSPWTTHVTYGPIAANGELAVHLVYDSRVLDGRCVAHCLMDLEQILHEDILPELRALPDVASRSSGPAARRQTEVKKPR